MRQLPGKVTLSRNGAVDAYGYILYVALIVLLTSNASFGAGKPDHSSKKIAEIVAALKKQFGLPNDIQITIEENNRLAVSVEPIEGHIGEFILSIDARFLDQLDEDEMTAAVAHELGHVWIYTHHPFLQTEALANQIALRVVARDSLKKLYAKLWAFEGTAGNLDELLGPDDSFKVVQK